MFVKLRIMAHDALKNYMHGEHPPLLDATTRLIYDIVKTAETNEAFANSFDMECAEAFDDQTADGYDELVMLIAEDDSMPEDLRDLLVRYNIIAAPFAVRLSGEDFDTFATLDEARKCFNNVEKLYND